MQLFALFEVLEVNTVSTTIVISLLCARLYFALKAHRLITVTALASPLQVHPALRTNQPTVRQNKFFCIFTHFSILVTGFSYLTDFCHLQGQQKTGLFQQFFIDRFDSIDHSFGCEFFFYGIPALMAEFFS